MFKPVKVKQWLDVLNNYTINDKLETADIFHLYPSKKHCYPDGFYFANWMEVHLYNSATKEKRIVPKRDALNTYDIPIRHIGTYVDSSVMLVLHDVYSLDVLCTTIEVKDIIKPKFSPKRQVRSKMQRH